MSPRPKKATDEEIFSATERAMMRYGPRDLSLSRVAEEAGVTASALVQRYGSKRKLMLAVMDEWTSRIEDQLRAIRSHRRSPLAALYDYAEHSAAIAETPQTYAHHLEYLQWDLGDAEFRKRMQRAAIATRAALQTWLEEAVATGQLKPRTDCVQLSELVEVTLSGSALTWVVHEEGTSTGFVKKRLKALLAPYRKRQ